MYNLMGQSGQTGPGIAPALNQQRQFRDHPFLPGLVWASKTGPGRKNRSIGKRVGEKRWLAWPSEQQRLTTVIIAS